MPRNFQQQGNPISQQSSTRVNCSAKRESLFFFMTQFPLGIPNLPLHFKQGAHCVNRKKIHWFFYMTKKEKEKKGVFCLQFHGKSGTQGAWQENRDLIVREWGATGGKKIRENRRKGDKSQEKNLSSERFMDNGVAGEGLGMAQDQISAKNFPIPPFFQGGNKLLAASRKIPTWFFVISFLQRWLVQITARKWMAE